MKKSAYFAFYIKIILIVLIMIVTDSKAVIVQTVVVKAKFPYL